MPYYKRKRVRKSFKSKRDRSNQNNDIVMENSKSRKDIILPENNIKVVRGAKLKRKHRMNIFLVTTAIICVVCLILNLILPVSLYENFVNSVSLTGHGSYPIETMGSTVLNTVSTGSYYYVLSDTNITAYSNVGKQIFSEMHGFSNPILSVSDTRALVFDQGGKVLYIYNLSGQIHTIETEYEIISANISRNGTFAVATQSNNYTSTVNVYDKNCNQVYTWNSAKDIVNNVLVNKKGDKIAVSTLNAVSGQYESKVLILNFESADALYTLDLDSSVVLSLDNTGKGISVITSDKYKFINWTKFTISEISSSGEINIFRKSKNGVLLVFNRANDRSDNTVILVSNKGTKISEFKINNIITDIRYAKGRVYYITDTSVVIADRDGELLRGGSCDYGTKGFTVIGSNSLAVMTDSEIFKVEIEKGE